MAPATLPITHQLHPPKPTKSLDKKNSLNSTKLKMIQLKFHKTLTKTFINKEKKPKNNQIFTWP